MEDKDMRLVVKDTTFRDGVQGEGVEVTNLNFVLQAILAMDGCGVSYHEVGFATANSKARQLIIEACKLNLQGKVCAFGRTHQADVQAMIELHQNHGLQVAVLVGKSRKRDAELSLQKDGQANLRMITNSVKILVDAGLEVIYDAEHFFQGFFEENTNYVLSTLKAALEAGASWLVLCDTNGKMAPGKATEAVLAVKKVIPAEMLGVHTHNDRSRAVANAEAAFAAGVSLVEGTFGGFGERCGNADLCSCIPNLVLDFGAEGISSEQMSGLTPAFYAVCDALNAQPRGNTPWVGQSAFYTEAGMHQSGLERDPTSYLHESPILVGNRTRVGTTDQSGRANFASKAVEMGIEILPDALSMVARKYGERIDAGADFGLAGASFHLFLLRVLQKMPEFFNCQNVRLAIEMQNGQTTSEAILRCGANGRTGLQIAEGDGPVNAMDNVLRQSLSAHYPVVQAVKLIDFKVRPIDIEHGAAAKVRVLIQFSDGERTWAAMAAHENIIEASWEALLDGYLYKLAVIEQCQPANNGLEAAATA